MTNVNIAIVQTSCQLHIFIPLNYPLKTIKIASQLRRVLHRFAKLFRNSKTQQPVMDTEELEPIDVLAYITEDLQGKLRNVKDVAGQVQVMQDFLRHWDTDSSLDSLKKFKFEFQKDLDWFNVSQPLSTEALRGKLVIMDFFTYCCINCMHVLPELHALEELYSVERGLVVVGVHSPKFENEKDAGNILSAAQRYGIGHPIVNDPRSTLWRAIGIRCWPSLLVLSPNGIPMLLLMGEGHGAFLERFVDVALKFFDSKGEIKSFSLPMRPSTDLLPASNLRFPAKIAQSDDGRFAIADAGNNRLLIIDRNGTVLHKIGGCGTGFIDGDFAMARFNSPQGVAFLNENVLIVADTENHALRQITLSTKRVETLAGTGQQGSERVGGKIGPLQAISSPWDVAIFRTRDMDMSFHLDEKNVPEKTIILIAMAGTHQIWGYFPDGIILWKFRKFDPLTCAALVGNGMEENRNNSYPQNAAFAQPSGLAMAKDFLYIADSESSSIRKVSMLDGKVMPVVGGDRNPLNLFAFGDVDGKQYNAKLQHPLGVAYNPLTDKVYVADTYNHKIKVIDTSTNIVETLAIKTESGALYQFNEPAGLCFDSSGQFLLVSDTNNHNLQLVDMETLITKNFSLTFDSCSTEIDAPVAFRSSVQLIKRLPLRAYKDFRLNVNFKLDESLKFTANAPQKWSLNANNSALFAATTSGQLNDDGKMILQMKRSNAALPQAEEHVKLDISLSLCDANSCLMKRFVLILNDADELGVDAADTISEEILNVYITPDEIKLS